MRSCRYLNESFCQANQIEFCWFVEQWAYIAESAENEAQKIINEQGAD